MEYCLLCHKEGHTAFYCDSARAHTVEEAMSHWMYNRLCQLYSTRGSVEGLLTQRFDRLSAGDLLYLMREYVDDKNKSEFAKMYNKNQLICFLLAHTTRHFLRIHFADLTEDVKKRISIDIRYWIARAKMSLEDAVILRLLEIAGPCVPTECGVCLRDGLCRGEMVSFECAHSFCGECVDRMSAGAGEFKCPLCRERVLHMVRRTEREPNYIFEQCIV
jgi:DNA-directed RNA polymerase subunit RPC12/RpoP